MHKKSSILVGLIIGVVFCTVLSLSSGAFNISMTQSVGILLKQIGFSTSIDFTESQESVLLFIRLPRVFVSLLVGASLSVAGVGMQGLFRNPLADPSLIGISSGAVLGAALAILMGWNIGNSILGMYGLSIATFIGAALSIIIVLRISQTGKSTDIATMLMSGIAINSLTGALVGLIIYCANDDQLRNITFWTLGSLGGANWKMVGVLLPLTILPVIIIIRVARQLDIYALGETEAACLGVNTQRLKYIIITCVTITVGASVALVGIIGFVGLVVPHITRFITGASHYRLFITSSLIGAIILSLADLASRTIVSPTELPIGILTSIMGTPLFISLLIRRKKKARLHV